MQATPNIQRHIQTNRERLRQTRQGNTRNDTKYHTTQESIPNQPHCRQANTKQTNTTQYKPIQYNTNTTHHKTIQYMKTRQHTQQIHRQSYNQRTIIRQTRIYTHKETTTATTRQTDNISTHIHAHTQRIQHIEDTASNRDTPRQTDRRNGRQANTCKHSHTDT